MDLNLGSSDPKAPPFPSINTVSVNFYSLMKTELILFKLLWLRERRFANLSVQIE